MKTDQLVQIPVDLLWEYRDLQREAAYVTAAFAGGINMYDVLEITEYIRTYGIEPLELSVIDSKALLTDGNHRIVAARRLGLEDVPVTIKVHGEQENEQNLNRQKLKHFKPINGHLEALLKGAKR